MIFSCFFLQRTLDIYVYCHINNTIPKTSNSPFVLISDKNWPTIEQTIKNLLNLKTNHIQFTNVSDVRIVDIIPKMYSIQAKYLPTLGCNSNGCLRVLGKIIFSIGCPLACQLRKVNKTNTLNVIQPSVILSVNSTSNVNYLIELDAFTIVAAIPEGEKIGDQVRAFMFYSLMGNNDRAFSSTSISVDDSSLINITRLIDESINKSNMDIYKFIVLQAEVIMESSILNVTVVFTFTTTCKINCQQIQMNKLNNTNSMILNPIAMIYDKKNHFHNVSLIDVLITTPTIVSIPTTGNPIIPNNVTAQAITESTQSSLIFIDLFFYSIDIFVETAKTIFEATYRLESFDFILDGDFESGPIIDNSTLNDLTNMMQTTVSNDSNINVIVFNATIDIDNEQSTTKPVSSDSTNYILRLIVSYIYPIACNACIEICESSIYDEPQLDKLIEIRNASLIDISRPVSVINLTPNTMTTIISSTHTVTMSTVHSSTTHSADNHTIKITTTTVVHSTTSQHPITENTTTAHHTSDTKTSSLHTTTSNHTLK
ncbi:unnamed protein product [Rotaria socialis]|uniref:Uncharacterized protein n=3 Tax=Rotaria socialis TaxID=392032 RepID=A0A818WHS5_9BILA|nr:unnamed protein product [Rotaria socialis]